MLLAGTGNLLCSDDGLGPEVVRQLVVSESLPAHVRPVDYGIRWMHLAYDLLEDYQALVIVDAVPGDGEPGDISVLERVDDAQAEEAMAGLEMVGRDRDPSDEAGVRHV